MDDRIFRQICEAAPDGIIVVDWRGCIVLANPHVEQMFGWSRDQVLNHHVEDLLPMAARDAHVGMREDYAKHPATRPMGSGRRLLALRKDGTEFPVEISLSPVLSGGEQHVVAIVRDISDRQRLETEREHLRAIANREEERQLIAMNLHDGVIQSIYAAALNLEMASEDVKARPDDAVAQINRAIDQLNDTIRDLRLYILDLRPARYVGDLSESLVSLLAEFRANSLIEVTTNIPDVLPRISEGHESAIFHVVQEALNNVRKHSRATELTLSITDAAGVLELDVIDNGVGFDPASPLDESHQGMRNMLSRSASASGLLRIETAPGSGTRVHVEVPLEEAEQGGDPS